MESVELTLVPVTVTPVCAPVCPVLPPVYVELLYAAVSVSVVVPNALADVKLIEEGEKLPVTPVGSPPAESATVPVNSLSADTLKV